MEKRIKSAIIPRNGTSAQWTAANPVLLKGELGLENDTRRMKIGDGITACEDLPYATQEGGGSVTAVSTPYIVNVKDRAFEGPNLVLQVSDMGDYKASDLVLYLYVNGSTRHQNIKGHYIRRGWRHPAHGGILFSEKKWWCPVEDRITEIDLDDSKTSFDKKTGTSVINLDITLRDIMLGFTRRIPLTTSFVYVNCLRIGSSVIGHDIVGLNKRSSHYNLRGRFGFALHEKVSKKIITPIYPINMSVDFRISGPNLNGTYPINAFQAHIL